MIEKIKELLNNVRILTDINKKMYEAKLAHGDAFNLFNELGMTTDEVHLHSSFIALLLNPKATHGQGDKFLKPFIEMIEKKRKPELLPMNFDYSNANVCIEKDIGVVKDEFGGRIDIYIEDNNGHHVIIENKIYAEDQAKQMKRYWNYAQEISHNEESKYCLIYLTLDGHEPSKGSLCGLKPDDYICLSYKYDIMKWLNRCMELSVRQPLLRETIIQYIDTLKQLTYSDMDNSDEILKIMSKEEYLEANFVIANNINVMICNILNNTLYPQLLSLAQSKGFELNFYRRNTWMTDSYAGWTFEHPEWKNFRIGMEFGRRGLGNLIIGFLRKNDKKRADIKCWDELWKKTTTIDKNNQLWIYRYFHQYPYWNNPQSLRAIIDRVMIKHISDAIDELIDCAKGLEI